MGLSHILFLASVGFIAGIWNALASGATLFTFPALVYVGLPPLVANATNFLALWPANAAALPAYRDELFRVGWRKIAAMAVASGIGAAVGSLLLIASGDALFLFLVPYLILAATGIFAFGDQISRAMTSGALGQFAAGPTMPLILLAIFSIYGGYFGAGLGIILLATMQIMRYTDYPTANSLKNLLATTFTLVSIVVFGMGGLIAWREAAVMMVASSLGGYAGGWLGKKANPAHMKIALVCFGLFLGFYYLLFKPTAG